MPKRLLLVDSDPGDLSSLERCLAPLGHDLRRAEDSASARSALACWGPDLVVLEPGLQAGDGLEVLRQIRCRGAGQPIPVVVLAARAGRDERLRALEAGADDFFAKPADGPLLCPRITTLLRGGESLDRLCDLNTELALRNAGLERLLREQRELTAFIVHDLKNPLSAVSSSLEYVREQSGRAAFAQSVAAAIEEADGASRRLRSMIEDLLIVSRLEQSEFPLHLEAVPISELLADVLREYRRRAEDKGVELVDPPLVKARVTGDRSLIQRVLENILDNSLRYTPIHGRVGVATRVDGCVEIAVSNSGPSIPPAERLRIFDKYARIEGAVAPRGNAGLGLYFCKRAMDSLGGNIEVTETADWPTSFIVRLPMATHAA